MRIDSVCTEWKKFPDPRHGGMLAAPFGPGCYELRLGNELVLFGTGKNVAYRMSSLLPEPFGAGHRSNSAKRDYVLANLGSIEYRTLACATAEGAKEQERRLKNGSNSYRFPT
ncbi:hypothetical protein [Cupriavidus sp. BIS7]|uniref:hypothetical protein n=1 Tax=Cupriavidus sp. BIS7 TaxID=1217718 RepID=UPI000A069BC1|nr:hypothetical protein [Cupriavidus sp. BIS7]